MPDRAADRCRTARPSRNRCTCVASGRSWPVSSLIRPKNIPSQVDRFLGGKGQDLRRKWVKADYPEKRWILDLVCLNLVLEGATLVISTRKPFNCLVEGLSIPDSGEAGIRTRDKDLTPYNGLANRRLQPLGHLSKLAGAVYLMLLAVSKPPPVRARLQTWPGGDPTEARRMMQAIRVSKDLPLCIRPGPVCVRYQGV